MDILDNGTRVRVGNEFGTVVGHKIAIAVPSGKIVVHTIRFTERRVRKFGNNWVIKPIDPVEKTINYSFIEVEQ